MAKSYVTCPRNSCGPLKPIDGSLICPKCGYTDSAVPAVLYGLASGSAETRQPYAGLYNQADVTPNEFIYGKRAG